MGYVEIDFAKPDTEIEIELEDAASQQNS
jgi:hypothetical protein